MACQILDDGRAYSAEDGVGDEAVPQTMERVIFQSEAATVLFPPMTKTAWRDALPAIIAYHCRPWLLVKTEAVGAKFTLLLFDGAES